MRQVSGSRGLESSGISARSTVSEQQAEGEHLYGPRHIALDGRAADRHAHRSCKAFNSRPAPPSAGSAASTSRPTGCLPTSQKSIRGPRRSTCRRRWCRSGPRASDRRSSPFSGRFRQNAPAARDASELAQPDQRSPHFSFSPQHLEVGPLRRSTRRSGRGARRTLTTSPACSGKPGLAVERDEDLSFAVHDRPHVRLPTTAGITTGRLVSMCGAIGVSSDRVDGGMDDRSARREVVGGRSGRARDDQAVGAHAHDRLVADRRPTSSMMRDSAPLRDHDVVEHERDRRSGWPLRAACAPRSIMRVSMCARPSSTASSDVVELGERDLGEEAEAAEVDAEDRDVGARRARCGRPCR